MLAAVIPACNEEASISHVLDELALVTPLDVIIPVLNGCTDRTRQRVLAHSLAAQSAIIDYPLPLGIDVPRSWGARCAMELGAQAVLFVDGDLNGQLSGCLQQLADTVCTHRCDLALTNCYPYIDYRSETARTVLSYREQLNRRLGLLDTIGLATPSHGPHCLSISLLERIGCHCLSVPPLMLAMAVQAGCIVQVAAQLTNEQWSSRQRGDVHNQRIAHTIIGDCIAAMEYLAGQPITRTREGICYLGYRRQDGAMLF